MKKQKTFLAVMIISSTAIMFASAQSATPTVTTVPDTSTVNGTVNSGTPNGTVDQTVTPTSATVPGMPNTALGNDQIAYLLTAILLFTMLETTLYVRKTRMKTKSATAKN